MKSSSFTSSNGVLKSVIKTLRRNGQDVSQRHPPSQSQTCSSSKALSPRTASRLVKKVWFEFQLHLARHGRQGNQDLTRDAFELKQNENGIEYFTVAHDRETKNHSRGLCKPNYMLPWTLQLQPQFLEHRPILNQ